MGLDTYAFATDKSAEEVLAGGLSADAAEEISYWRKHPNLHGWLEKLYREKGGEREFNCVPVVVTGEDIDRLEVAVREQNLPHTTGFFFGASCEEDEIRDIRFIERAREELARGRTVFCLSWW